jgi:hypothetical protein
LAARASSTKRSAGRRIEVGGQDLDRDLGADRRLHAQVDHPHAALAEAVDEAIAGELGAEQRIGSARGADGVIACAGARTRSG